MKAKLSIAEIQTELAKLMAGRLNQLSNLSLKSLNLTIGSK